MGFFPEIDEQICDFDSEIATEFFTFLKKKNPRLRIRYSEKKWAGAIAALRLTDGCRKKRIRRVMDFYLKNFRVEYVPLVFSTDGFRRKFLAIENAARREQNKPPEKIRVTDTAREIQRACGYLIWPGKKEAAAELEFIQLSYDRYTEFVAAICAAAIQRNAAAELERRGSDTFTAVVGDLPSLLTYLQMSLPDPVEYICDWARRVHLMAYEWDAWHGDLLRAAWRRDSKSFVRAMRAAVAAYSGDPADWDRIVAALDS